MARTGSTHVNGRHDSPMVALLLLWPADRQQKHFLHAGKVLRLGAMMLLGKVTFLLFSVRTSYIRIHDAYKCACANTR